jgi:hypothetical protein
MMIGVASVILGVAVVATGGPRGSDLVTAAVLGVTGVFVSRSSIVGDELGLTIRLGPGVRVRRIAWSEIAACHPVESPSYGLGIRYLGDGWMYNLSGGGVVELKLSSGKRVQIGTDDSAGLIASVRGRIGVA